MLTINNAIIPIGMIIGLILFSELLAAKASSKRAKKKLEKRRLKEIHHKPHQSLIIEKPQEGHIILGKRRKEYVALPLKKIVHCFLAGTSGGGKSAAYVINWIMDNPKTPKLVLDIKGELHEKAVLMDDAAICIIDPTDHTSYGFDVFSSLPVGATLQEVKEAVELVSIALIPMPKSGADKYWYISGRTMMTGLMGYYYMLGEKDLIRIIERILGSPIKEQLNKALAETPALFGNNSFIYQSLIEYQKMDDSQFHGVYSTVTEAINCFGDEDLKYTFSTASQKVGVDHLETGKSIFLSIPENKLVPYAGALTMIFSVMLTALSKRPDTGADDVMIILDELGRLVSANASLSILPDYMMTLRSKKVHIFLVLQQLSALESGFSKGQIASLIGNCSTRILLDGSSEETTKSVCDYWAGQTINEHRSTSYDAKRISSTRSYDIKNALVAEDLNRLPRDDEALVITNQGYCIVKKAMHYNDPNYMERAAIIKRHNVPIISETERKCAGLRDEERNKQLEELQDRKAKYDAEKEIRMAFRKKKETEKAMNEITQILNSPEFDDDEDEEEIDT